MISAIISTYNREKYLPKLFKSICEQNYLDFEILIIDNNSPGNTKELTEIFIKNNPKLTIKYFLETQQGLSFGRNRGITEATGDFIIFLDDDAFISNNYFQKIAFYFNQYSDVMAIGSKILLDYESIIPKWENPFLNSLLGYFNLGNEIQYFATLRFIPIPFIIQNAVLTLLNISQLKFIISTILGITPWMIIYSLAGFKLKELINLNENITIEDILNYENFFILGLFFLLIFLSTYLKKKIN